MRYLLLLLTALSAHAIIDETELNTSWKLLYFDDFEDGTFGNYSDGGTDCGLVTNASYVYSGTRSLKIQDNTASSFTQFTSNMNLADKHYHKLRIHFKYYVRSFTGTQHFNLQYSSDGGVNWVVVKSFDLNDFTNGSFTDAEVILIDSSYTFSDLSRIRFECEGGNDDDKVYLDDISIHVSQFNTIIGNLAGQNNTTGRYNTFIGKNSGHRNTTGYYNTFLGLNSGLNNTTGYHNTFLGLSAGVSNSNGYENTFVGRGAGENNTTGFRNTFIGRSAGDRNTSADYNTFIGFSAGFSNTTGTNNTYLGSNAGRDNQTSNANVFIGYAAGERSKQNHNTYIGKQSGYLNVNGKENTFVGSQSGQNSTEGDYNVFMGVNAGYDNQGNLNTFIGRAAGRFNAEGTGNSFIGHTSGWKNTIGSQNTYLGVSAGYHNLTGSNNVFIGFNVGANETGSNKLYIDNNATATPLIYGEFDNNKLQINGELRVTNGIRTNEVNVQLQSAWPDYVFADDYQLPTIAEMANHIKEHKHLPGVPSAADIAKDGLDMAKVMSAQMEKIEELSLYIIELKKENNTLKDKLDHSIENNQKQIQSILQKLEGK
ncbi:hypothetical protein LNTAR_05026 [Lentisphaera araneosa HTCC2155]|uniref:Peptidase S74 domain-containing protein n=1 Tax=Lentisphaera araneosa HTCC2155 TaxID=313628 RepID=A6DLJ2_9BACT|nr:cell division protein ZapB [Lentisphaera araneosa]EDM27447.1 hypothetical protein LNTAR_05026 [Lentisphaera araneosa HTCC2155]